MAGQGQRRISGATANYVLSYAFSDQVLLTYARAAVAGLREKAAEAAGRMATRHTARNTRARRRRSIRRS